MTYKLGSLFDGSGGFPLAASLCGIDPVWASEVEPYPIAVTRTRFPGMRHLGDISKVNGAEIEPVHAVTFGSPCQDLSTAGAGAGLKHKANGDEETTRSGLFMEAVRIIKEMRAATNGVYPRFVLWENVPGAFNSNKGEDFRTVLQALIQIIEPAAVMPEVPKNGWSYADHYCGDGWSLAYRLFDTQYWPGTPQRRQRIHLVVDFGGQCARQVCFEREGLRGYFDQSGTPWQAAAGYAEKCTGAADCKIDSAVQSYGWPLGFRPENTRVYEEVATTICNGTRPGFTCGVMVPYTLKIRSGCEGGGKGALVQTNKSATIKTCNDQYLFQPVYSLQSPHGTANKKQNGAGVCENVSYTLTARDNHAVACCSTNEEGKAQYIVRRLTPTECARLQGFPDEWGHIDRKDELTAEEFAFWQEVRNTHAAINGKVVKDYTPAQMLTWYNKLHTDSAEYKMWGNGIALPPALYCMQGITDALKKTRGGNRNV